VRFWFSPRWTSLTNGGTGPGSFARLLTIGSWSSNASIGVWQLALDSAGDRLSLVVQDNAGHSAGTTNLVTPSVIVSNQWHQIAVVYTPSNTAIYVDGTRLGSGGAGLTNIVPPQLILDQGFYLGTDNSGSQKSKAAFEFLETFNYPKTSTQISAEYTDTDADGVSNIQDGNLSNAAIGRLTITIERPQQGATITR